MTKIRGQPPLVRVMGVDPGTLKLGWGIIDVQGTRLHHVDHGTITTTAREALAVRLCEIHDELSSVIAHYSPNEAAVESLFFAKDAMAASKLGHARGVVLLLLAKGGLSIGEYPPARIKKTLTGRGRAAKLQVAAMVQAILGLRKTPEPDAADALAVAITHAQISRLDRLLAKGRK